MKVKDLVIELLKSNPDDDIIIEFKNKQTKDIEEVNIIKHLKLVVLK